MYTTALLLTLASSPARAQNDAASQQNPYRSGPYLSPRSDVQRAKRREAKRSHRWVLTAVGGNAIGYDSNIHDSPDDVEGSAAGGFGARVELLRYIGEASRVKLIAEATGLQHAKTSKTSPYDQVGRFFYSHRASERLSLTTSARVRHSNDSETTIDGETFDRNFEYFSYLASAGAWLYLTRDHKVRITASGHRRDYVESPAMRSLDWWKVGPRVAYHFEPIDGVDLQAFYSYTLQSYDENRASTATGRVLSSSPAETHSFHRAGMESSWSLGHDLTLDLGYAYRTKNDRFQGYESYAGHTVELSGEWSPSSRWSAHAGARYRHRDYERRPSSGAPTLEYGRWTASIGASCHVWKRVSLFVDYSLDLRDTNRWAGELAYRDYARHVALTGYSVTY